MFSGKARRRKIIEKIERSFRLKILPFYKKKKLKTMKGNKQRSKWNNAPETDRKNKPRETLGEVDERKKSRNDENQI